MPEVASSPEKVKVTAWLYQPLLSAERSGVPTTLVGAVASRLMTTLLLCMPPLLLALQVSVVPLVSVLIVVGPQPVWLLMAESGSTTLQLTVTSEVYQPSLPRVPVRLGVMTGGVLSG